MTPPMSHLAIRIGGIDKPDDRKVHSYETPRLGGIALFCAFLFSVLFFIDIDRQIKSFLAGAIVIFLTGLVDDLSCLSPRNKLIGQIVASCVSVISGGLFITTLGNPLGLGQVDLGVMGVPFTLFVVVGVINAINLIDGLDGLAGGVSAVACLAFGVLAWKTGNSNLLALVVALVGAIFGFLRYNTYPARIFMGDSGSLFLGYCMAFFSVILLKGSHGSISPVAPLIILGVPIFDTLVVMCRRKLTGKRVSSPDKTHIHHRLMDLGFGHRFSVLMIYGWAYLLAVSALLLQGTRDSIQMLTLVLFCAGLYAFLTWLNASNKIQNINLLQNNSSLRLSNTYRSIVTRSRVLLVIMKYLLMLVLSLVVIVKPYYESAIAFAGGALLIAISLLLIIGSRWSNSILQYVIYLSGLLGIFIIENYGYQSQVYGFNLVWISHLLFASLFSAVVIKTVLRQRAVHLMNSKFEYLILFVVLAIPLFPANFIEDFHLMSVAAKSAIMFVAYKLILMRQVRKNRKILAATFFALLALVIRYLLHQ